MKIAVLNRSIRMYKDVTLIHQMKSLEAVELPSGRIAIRKPTGGRDDIVDSLMMACSPYIETRVNKGWRFAGFKKEDQNYKW